MKTFTFFLPSCLFLPRCTNWESSLKWLLYSKVGGHNVGQVTVKTELIFLPEIEPEFPDLAALNVVAEVTEFPPRLLAKHLPTKLGLI